MRWLIGVAMAGLCGAAAAGECPWVRPSEPCLQDTRPHIQEWHLNRYRQLGLPPVRYYGFGERRHPAWGAPMRPAPHYMPPPWGGVVIVR